MTIQDTIEFRIRTIDWELFLVNSEDIEGVGEVNYNKYEIYISKDLKNSQTRTVLIHELTHAFRWTYGCVSEMELMNIPSVEVEELIANTVEVYAEEILALTDRLMGYIKKLKKGGTSE